MRKILVVKNMKGDKTDVYVSLYGYNDELKQLNEFLDSPECHLEQFKETNERYFLTACRFSNLTEVNAIIESAKKLVTIIKAFAKIELGGDFQSINIGTGKTIIDNKDVTTIIKRAADRQEVSIILSTLGVTASVISATTTITGAEPSTAPEHKKSVYYDYLNRCDEEIHGNIFDALYFFAEETSYYSLYKAYETIKLDVDGNLELKESRICYYQWTTEEEIRNFRQSANCYAAIRDSEGKYKLRHSVAECRRSAEAPNVILDLSAAKSFIRHLMKNWLKCKCVPR
jgi:hypothetical protein